MKGVTTQCVHPYVSSHYGLAVRTSRGWGGRHRGQDQGVLRRRWERFPVQTCLGALYRTAWKAWYCIFELNKDTLLHVETESLRVVCGLVESHHVSTSECSSSFADSRFGTYIYIYTYILSVNEGETEHTWIYFYRTVNFLCAIRTTSVLQHHFCLFSSLCSSVIYL